MLEPTEMISTELCPRKPYKRTSLTEVTDKLPKKPPCRVLFKNEYEQPSKSFKLRGIGNLVSKKVDEAQKYHPDLTIHVFASSGGNAGLAAAYLAKFYGVKCTVAVPEVSKAEVRATIRDYGATPVIVGRNIDEADMYIQSVIANIDRSKIFPIYCHPFENPLIWEGHSSLVSEIEDTLSAEEAAKVKAFVCSVGGGGLYNGIYAGLQQLLIMRPDLLILETNQAPTFSETIRADKQIKLSAVNSLATSLACSYMSERSLHNYKDQSVLKTTLEVIDDLDAVKGCVDFYESLSVMTEPACGAALSIAYRRLDLLTKNLPNLKPDDIIVVVVCGGVCSTPQDFKNFKLLIEAPEPKL